MSDYDWISPTCPGYTGKDIINHKSPDCTAVEEWTHIWGGRYCETCWPCTDEAMKATELGVDND